MKLACASFFWPVGQSRIERKEEPYVPPYSRTQSLHSRTTFSESDLEKAKHPIFLDEFERELLNESEADGLHWLLEPSAHVTGEKPLFTLDAVVKFCGWFEEQECSRLLYK